MVTNTNHGELRVDILVTENGFQLGGEGLCFSGVVVEDHPS